MFLKHKGNDEFEAWGNAVFEYCLIETTLFQLSFVMFRQVLVPFSLSVRTLEALDSASINQKVLGHRKETKFCCLLTTFC